LHVTEVTNFMQLNTSFDTFI